MVLVAGNCLNEAFPESAFSIILGYSISNRTGGILRCQTQYQPLRFSPDNPSSSGH